MMEKPSLHLRSTSLRALQAPELHWTSPESGTYSVACPVFGLRDAGCGCVVFSVCFDCVDEVVNLDRDGKGRII